MPTATDIALDGASPADSGGAADTVPADAGPDDAGPDDTNVDVFDPDACEPDSTFPADEEDCVPEKTRCDDTGQCIKVPVTGITCGGVNCTSGGGPTMFPTLLGVERQADVRAESLGGNSPFSTQYSTYRNVRSVRAETSSSLIPSVSACGPMKMVIGTRLNVRCGL
ncbi:MAG: hypothetical protein ACI9OJ_001876 [Myxococcota bacterium]